MGYLAEGHGNALALKDGKEKALQDWIDRIKPALVKATNIK